MFRIKFVLYIASITYLCHTYLITTFKILYVEYRPIRGMSEFSYSLISLTASAPKILHRLGPTLDRARLDVKVPGHLRLCRCGEEL